MKKTIQEMKEEASKNIPQEWENIQIDTSKGKILESSQEILKKMRSEDNKK